MAKYDSMAFAVRLRVLAKLLSQMYGILAVLTLVPAGVALWFGAAWGRYLAVSAFFAVCWALGRRIPGPHLVQTNEALATVALLFVSTSLIMAWPIMGYGIPFLDAWFEAVSGVTTTGLSTLDAGGMSDAFLFGRGWMQWVGGVGVVVLALALIVRPGAASGQLGFSKLEMDDVVGGTRAHARRVVIIYLLLTAAGIAALLGSGAPLLDALVHSMAAVSTGGFANYDDSLAGVGDASLLVVNVLCVAGAVSFHVYYSSLLRARRGEFLDNQLYALLIAAVGSFLLLLGLSRITGLELDAADLATLVVSAQTTGGFSTLDTGSMPAWLLLFLCLSMSVGGGLGSTAGGLKLGRAILLLRLARLSLRRTALPGSVHVVPDRGRGRFEPGDVEEVLVLVFWFVGVLLVSWMLFLLHGYDAVPALFEVTSALSTTGLSAGLSSEELPGLLKFVLCCDMLFGRVEVLALLVVLSPRTWLGRRRSERRPA